MTAKCAQGPDDELRWLSQQDLENMCGRKKVWGSKRGFRRTNSP